MKIVSITYLKAKSIRFGSAVIIISLCLLLTNCNDSNTTDQWEIIKSEKRVDMIVLFASNNLNNSLCDSAISLLSDTSLHFSTEGMVLKDSLDFKRNLATVYPEFEYVCLSALPPYLDRVAFRIHINESDTICINRVVSSLDEIKTSLIEFISNENKLDSLPPKKLVQDDKWGEIETTQAVVEIYSDIYKSTNIPENFRKVTEAFKMILDAYNSIREKNSQEQFNTTFNKLSSEQKDIIIKMNPLRLYLKPNVYSYYYPHFTKQPPVDLTEVLNIVDDDTIKMNNNTP